MPFIIEYRKPKYHNFYPWRESFETVQATIDFVEKLSEEYDFQIFQSITLGDLYDRDDEDFHYRDDDDDE